MKPTAEQLEAVERFRDGGALKINAFAGTGKTTTLQLLASSTNQRGMYLAFNKAIATEAKEKFPQNVNCSTLHSLAFRATPREFRHGDKMTGSLNANAFADHLGYKDAFFGRIKLTARQRGHLAKETLRHYMQGGRLQIDDRHVPSFEELGNLAKLDHENEAVVRAQAVEGAKAIWARMSDARNPVPLGHDGYLKLWALSKPELAADFVLLDEAQDTNPVVLGVLARQRAQIVYVGDRHQQIYDWRGAVNAMDLAHADHTTYLTTSFRFGERIADAASSVLKRLDEHRALTGNPDRESFIGSDACDAILARTNASVMSSVLLELQAGRKPHIVGGTGELIRMLRGVQDLKRGNPSDVAEFFGFTNWNEVIEFSKEPAGEQLRTFVGLVEGHGEEKLISSLHQTADDERQADVVVSTAHKAKGREWDTVELVDDFLPSKSDDSSGQPKIDEAEIRLFYVALTRARIAVEFSSAIQSHFNIPAGPKYANPKRSKRKPIALPVTKPVYAHIPKTETVKAAPSTIPNGSSEPHASGGIPAFWWLIGLGLFVFYVFMS